MAGKRKKPIPKIDRLEGRKDLHTMVLEAEGALVSKLQPKTRAQKRQRRGR